MTIDRWNLYSSGETHLDTTPEVVVVESIDNRRVTLLGTNRNARTLHKVIENGIVYTSQNWKFDTLPQTVTLGSDSMGNRIFFSGDHVPVTLVYTVGTPTETYLTSQPFEDSALLLNERTPPFLWAKLQDTLTKTFASTPAPVSRPYMDVISNLKYGEPRYFTQTQGVGNNISAICEGGEAGLVISLSGSLFTESFTLFQDPGNSQGWFILSGGGVVGSELNSQFTLNGGFQTQNGVKLQVLDTSTGSYEERHI
jgi:hypothetical protein